MSQVYILDSRQCIHGVVVVFDGGMGNKTLCGNTLYLYPLVSSILKIFLRSSIPNPMKYHIHFFWSSLFYCIVLNSRCCWVIFLNGCCVRSTPLRQGLRYKWILLFCYLSGVDAMRVISMVVVKGTLFTYLTYAEYFTSRVNVILLIFNDSITDVIWAGYTHMVSSALSASNSYFYCLK